MASGVTEPKTVVKRIGRGLGFGLGSLVIALALLAIYWRLDKTDVFYRVRGNYQGFEILESWDTENSRVRLVDLRNHRGESVASAYVRQPITLSPDYRIVLTYAGAKTRKKILDLIPERPDLVLVGVQYPYTSPRSFLQRLRWPYDVRRTGFRTVAGGMLAVDFLEQEQHLDLGRLVVIGSSLGSIPATLHAALDDRVPIVVLIHGGGDLPAVARAGMPRRWLGPPAGLAAEIILDTFDPIHYADRISPRKLMMIATRNDPFFPVQSVEKLYARAAEPKEIIWTETQHVRSRKSDLVDEILTQVEWLTLPRTLSGPRSGSALPRPETGAM